MRNFLISFILGMIVLLSSSSFAGFYVITGPGGKPVGTEITSLPTSIDSPGFYYITKDLTCTTCTAAGEHGITVTADNVTLDLMGFSLTGPGGTGVEADGINMVSHRTNVEIRNGTVRDFMDDGIEETGSALPSGHRIINLRIINNGDYGIIFSTASNSIGECTIAENSAGVYAGYGSTVTDNVVFGNYDFGITADSASKVTGNTVYNNGTDGIFVNGGSTVVENTAYSNGGDGIEAGLGSTVTGNTARDNNNDGIDAGSGSTVTGNTTYSNDNNGINAVGGSNVTGNSSRYNASFGIYLGGNNLVDQNTCTNNTGGNMNACATCTFGTNHAP